ncbi:hypothetical protein [Mesorhizobium sp. IMUNJ 23232]|uniref:hypothetical protein n=1 Tax=Mesorhizobium sp. IMUNJ 23232 TaxID=3376064 RepID=UPI00378B59DD
MSEQGFPDWTELGQDSGLDPLGMQRPIEVIYQSLIPGISTITLRFRYYSFFPFILRHYEMNIRNADPAVFRVFQRRCEALYALICTHGVRELGVAGSDWAARILASSAVREGQNGVVDFSRGADPEAEEQYRYLRNKGGAFGAIYATQMQAMGLLHFPTKDAPNPNPVCAEPALAVAEAFARELGDAAPAFFKAVSDGQIAISLLALFERMRPSRLRPGSSEHALLTHILLAKSGPRMENDTMRRSTLRMLLAAAETQGAIPHQEAVKWHWYETASSPSAPHLQSAPGLWFLYQACDLTRLAYEALFSAALTTLSSATRGRMSLSALVEELTEYADLPVDESWETFSTAQLAGGKTARELATSMLDAVGEPEDQVRYAIQLMAVLCDAAQSSAELVEEALSGADYFQSLRTETKYLQAAKLNPVQRVVADLVLERVLKRHLWVASRKFRNQKAYTFHMEPEDGVLRYRAERGGAKTGHGSGGIVRLRAA